MKSLARIATFAFLFTAFAALAQKPLAVKDSAASQFLNQLAKDHAADQAVFNTKLQQARFNLDHSNKTLQDQIQALQKSLTDKLKEDKKYKPLLDQIDALQKQFNENSQNAQIAFQKDSGELPQKIQTEAAQIESLKDVVRKENDLPADSVYNEDKQTWNQPAAKAEVAKPEPPKPEKK